MASKSSLKNLKDLNNMMKFGQVMAGGYEKYDMSTMPDAAAAMRRASDTAAAMPSMATALGECLKDGALNDDMDDAKAAAMTMFIMAERLVIESYTAVRLIKEVDGQAPE